MDTLTAFKFLVEIQNFGAGRFWSMENPKIPASNSELKRWIKANAFHINGRPVTPDEVIDYELVSVVLFPKNGKKRITIL
jgi:hypothetical protein